MRVKTSFKIIANHYKKLVEMTNKRLFVGIINEWILDNYYLILEQKTKVKGFCKAKKSHKYLTKNVDMYEIVEDILKKNNYRINQNLVIKGLNDYQEENNYEFLYQELALVPILITIIIINRISDICEHEGVKIREKEEADNLITTIKNNVSKEDFSLKDYLVIDENISNNFIIYFNEQLKELGDYSAIVFKELNESLASVNLALRDITHNEHINNAGLGVFTTNAFYTVKQAELIQTTKIFDEVSKIEALLKKDKYYDKMDDNSKECYRNLIIKEAKKEGFECLEYAEILINAEGHLGEYLFEPINSNKRARWYIFGIILLTSLISYFLSKYFIDNRILGFLILFIPVSEISIVVLNRILSKYFYPKPLMKMDFSKGIPKDEKTMVVIPTLIKDAKKVNAVFDNLENYYLSNKTNNLYFALLGDCAQENSESAPYDQDVAEAGRKKVEELNKKYKKEMFFFAYRRRFYQEGEGAWLGFERKRGGLLHFNELILGNLTTKEKEAYFIEQTFDNFKEDIKYVITLDVDTQLVMNSAQNMVATMAHPVNKPVLNEEGTQVISGYALMQPKITVDIDSTNQSPFTRIYRGVGGFDPYNSLTPNFYQDVFGEGSFMGKGIYDLKVFQKVLREKFPNNLILSHDLIEGCFIRAASLSDVELIDDFPSKYLNDATRRARWARGDMQIIGWLFPWVRNLHGEKIKNTISIISKWKIFDNIRRGLIYLFLMLTIICSFICGVVHPGWWALFVLLVVSMPSLFYFLQSLRIRRKEGVTVKYYNVLTYGNKALWLRNAMEFSSIPFNARLYIKSLSQALYRMLISKKRLLNWITAEEAEKTVKSDLPNVIKRFSVNYLVGLLIIIISLVIGKHYHTAIGLAIFFTISPFLAYFMSKDMNESTKHETSVANENYVRDIALRTWNFFADKMTKENNYLIPDNYQLNRQNKDDHKTSPTNIGLSLVSVVSAAELEFITIGEATKLIENVITSVEKLKKWNGHLYNWYNIHTLEVMPPNFVSSVDSGNLAVSLVVAKEFIRRNNLNDKLVSRIEKLLNNADFKELYTEEDAFSVGFNDDEERLLPYCYNKFASEARLMSYIAIAKGDVPSHHWFQLDKTLTVHNNQKGLLSWTGTAFEYFMPLIYMRTYPNTLIDESYYFSYLVQKDFMKEVDHRLPWGISESAYNELDDAQNYKYKAFGIPYLRLKEEPLNRIVISPYSSVLAITKFPTDVIHNMRKFKRIGLEGEYGFYESYDVDDKTPVYAYYAHHQGMILASLTNFLKNNVIQDYFMNEVNNRTFEILNKEKVQIKPAINLKTMRYKKYTYEKEEFASDMRVFKHISTMPEISVLSNAKYSVILNDRGNGFSRYRTIQLNRYRKITEQDYGSFIYIKDLDTNEVWSNTYAPMNIRPDKYEVVFNLDRIKYLRSDRGIMTTTEIVVAKMEHAEIRKVTFRNSSKKTRRLELTTYMEPIICNNNDDIAHRVYNNMFIRSEYDSETNSLIMRRKSKTSSSTYFLINRLLIEGVETPYQYETDRVKFIGRGNNSTNPKALNKKLTNYVGTALDPIMSLRNQITIESGKEKTVYFIIGFGKSKEQVMNIVNTYNNKTVINERAFEVATIMANVTNKAVNITGRDMKMYNTMLNYLYQTSKIFVNDERTDLLSRNSLGHKTIWKFGMSGDRPIIFVDIKSLENLSLVKEVLRAFEYYKSKSIFVDLVLLNSPNQSDAKVIAEQIEAEKYRMYAMNSFHKIPGSIYVIERSEVTEAEYNLISMAARLRVVTDKYNSLHQYVEELQRVNTICDLAPLVVRNSAPVLYDEKDITYYNKYGGFVNNGKEYLITNKNTPTIWSNVIANERFGTVVTNNNCGFTYALNSREFKITSWTNDTLLNDLSESIKINKTHVNYDLVRHGFGYSVFEAVIDDLEIEYTTYVSKDDMVKFYKYKIKNTDTGKRKVDLDFWINPTLGVSEDKTGRHILSNYDEENSFVSLRNVYHEGFNNINVFLTATKKLDGCTINQVLFKEIEASIELKSGEEKEIAFVMGCSDGTDLISVVKKYQDINRVNDELARAKGYWEAKLGVVKVNTPEDSFNYMLNGWLQYQALSSRLYARAGYYQVGGAFGFRDQLQDSMNLINVHPDIARRQIIINASHQFEQGDVLHWWHIYNRLGLRSRYKDDYLWMIYATSEYIKITGDYSILDEQVPFVEADELKDDEMDRGVEYNYSAHTASLYVHLEKALAKSMSELGENGIPLMGGGDWNDGMNAIGKNGKGTSVWLGFFLHMMIEKFMEFTKVHYPKENLKKYEQFNETLKESIQKNTWDGEYFLRAFFDNGDKVGSHENEECSIDLLSQSYAILSGIATKEQTKSILREVEQKLVDKNHKIVKLLTPAFANNKENPGYIMDYPKGIRENGGQYTHAVAWYIMALIKAGELDKAFEIYQLVNPINHSLTKEDVEKYQTEPYVIAADVYSNQDYAGKGGWTWYTGSAAWFYKVGIVDILGFDKIGDKLYIRPNVPKKWREYSLEYQYMDTKYLIDIKKDKTKIGITIDNKKIQTEYIPLVNDKKEHKVKVYVGE